MPAMLRAATFNLEHLDDRPGQKPTPDQRIALVRPQLIRIRGEASGATVSESLEGRTPPQPSGRSFESPTFGILIGRRLMAARAQNGFLAEPLDRNGPHVSTTPVAVDYPVVHLVPFHRLTPRFASRALVSPVSSRFSAGEGPTELQTDGLEGPGRTHGSERSCLGRKAVSLSPRGLGSISQPLIRPGCRPTIPSAGDGGTPPFACSARPTQIRGPPDLRLRIGRGIAMSIETVKARVEPDLMKLPNVVGCGIGEKMGRRVIKVFVRVKVPEIELDPGAVVPKTIEGYETDVEEIGEVTAEA